MALTEPRRGARDPRVQEGNVESVGVTERAHCKARPGTEGREKPLRRSYRAEEKVGTPVLLIELRGPDLGMFPRCLSIPSGRSGK